MSCDAQVELLSVAVHVMHGDLTFEVITGCVRLMVFQLCDCAVDVSVRFFDCVNLCELNKLNEAPCLR